MSLDMLWVKSHIRVKTTEVTLDASQVEIFGPDASRWGFAFPAILGSTNPLFIPRGPTASTSFFYFTQAQGQGGKTFWTYEDIGPVIEDRWFGSTLGGTLTYDVYEFLVPIEVKKIIENWDPRKRSDHERS